MLRNAGTDEASPHGAGDLCRILHPSYGLPRPVVLALLDDPGAVEAPETPSAAAADQLADVVPLHASRRPAPGLRRKPTRR